MTYNALRMNDKATAGFSPPLRAPLIRPTADLSPVMVALIGPSLTGIRMASAMVWAPRLVRRVTERLMTLVPSAVSDGMNMIGFQPSAETSAAVKMFSKAGAVLGRN